MSRLLFLLIALASLVPAPVHNVAVPRAAVVQEAIGALPDANGSRAWLERHRVELLAAIRRGRGARNELHVQAEIWRAAGRQLAGFGGIESDNGFVIYPPRVSLGLFLFDRMDRMYTSAMENGPAGIPVVDELLLLGGQRFEPSTPGKYPSVSRVKAALESLDIPPVALRGYRVFLMPFAMGDVSGQGGPGFTFLAAEPHDEQLIANQLEVTLVHEFGHHLHMTGMPRETGTGLKKWREYLSLRGLPWREDGPVNSSAWAQSPEETFAEDFRLLFGGNRANQEPSAAEAGDPRGVAGKAALLRRFMLDVAEGAVVPVGQDPWPEQGETARPAWVLVYPSRWLIAFLVMAAIPVFIVLITGRRRLKGAGDRPYDRSIHLIP